MKRILDARRAWVPASAVACLLIIGAGCDENEGRPDGASPVVALDSEQAQRAIAQSRAFDDELKAQEAKLYAKSRRRHRTLSGDKRKNQNHYDYHAH